MFSQAGFRYCMIFVPRSHSEARFSAHTPKTELWEKSQFQAMAGGQYLIRKGLTFCFGVLGGKYVASPRFGGQIGFAIDFP
jgi:hypothetical protein